MPQAAELRSERSKHGVVRVAGVAGFVRGHAVILEVRGRKIRCVIDVQALSVGVHDMAGEAERGALGAFHFIVHSGQERKERKKEKHAERKNLSSTADGNRGTHNKNAREYRAEQNEYYDRNRRHRAKEVSPLVTSSRCGCKRRGP